MKIGIDFGTSFSLPATVYINTPRVLLPGGKYGISSVFFYSNDEGVLIGEEAERAGQGYDANKLKREIKLELDSSFTADGRSFTAKQIVGHILNYVKENAIKVANEQNMNEQLEGVVISVPAAFGHNEKAIIKEAAEIPISQGGPQLKVLGFIKEPVAAALAYYATPLADKTKILVYDLGGGTCDIAIVEANSSTKEKYTVIDSDMIRIGGKNWDKKLEEYITHEIEKQSGRTISTNQGYVEKIKREAIAVKHAISDIAERNSNVVKARVEIDGRIYPIQITKELFDELTIGLFNATIKMTKELLAKNDGDCIEKIICVGGGSNMPQVLDGLKMNFPNKEIKIFEPEKAIAYGAAIYAQYCDGNDTFLSDVSAFSYGNRCYRSGGNNTNSDLIVVNLLKKGDRLPTTKVHSFLTKAFNQKSVTFKIVENTNLEDKYKYTKECDKHVIMDVNLKLPPNTLKGTKIKLYITLTLDGMIEVTADDEKGHKITAKKQLYVENI